MHMGERRMRGQLPVTLTGIGTGKAHPYHPPVWPARSTASSNTSTWRSRRRDLRHTTLQNRETLPHIRSREGTLERQHPGCYVDPQRTRHHPLHHQLLHHQPHPPPTIVLILIAIVDLYSNLFHSFHPLHKIMMMFLIASMCE